MKVKEIMSKHPDALSEETTLIEAAKEMAKHDFGFIPVKQNEKLTGVVTDRDIVIRALAKEKNPNTLTLKDVMTSKIIYCHSEDEVTTAVQIMRDKQIHRLAVYDKGDNLCGIISIGDISKKCKDAVLLGKLTESIYEH